MKTVKTMKAMLAVLVGQLEYRLQPLDASRSRLTVRYVITPPPGMTRQAAVAMLRSKAAVDLADFAKAGAAATAVALEVTP